MQAYYWTMLLTANFLYPRPNVPELNRCVSLSLSLPLSSSHPPPPHTHLRALPCTIFLCNSLFSPLSSVAWHLTYILI